MNPPSHRHTSPWTLAVTLAALATALSGCGGDSGATSPNTTADAGDTDSGVADTDSAEVDTGGSDTAIADTATTDTAIADTATTDTASADTGVADTAVEDAGDAEQAFALVERREATCEGDSCAAWPPAEQGTMWRYESDEAFAEATWRRTFHAYTPSRLTEPGPLVILLHGGFSSGLEWLERPFDEYADGRVTAWRPNTEGCQFTYPDGYQDPQTQASCLPPRQTLQNTEPFTVVFADGLQDRDSETARHWEDGRTPSPGWGDDASHRDDVGFIAHIIEVMLAQEGALIDPERISVMGASNGGMMTQRVACHVGDPRYPALSRIAAFGVSIASLPSNLVDGANGRERCLSHDAGEIPLMFLVGRGIETPDCESYPCRQPTSDGDGRMPYGTPGARHNTYSPDPGEVVSHDDALQLWVDHNARVAGDALEPEAEEIGWFTTHAAWRFEGSEARVESWVVDGGAHDLGGTRFDVHPFAPLWDFVSRFRRLPDGRVRYDDASPFE